MTLNIERPKTRKSGHTRAKAPIISLDQPGRLRVAHLLALFATSHSSLYAGMRRGRYPRPSGYDGTIPFWDTAVVRAFLETRMGKGDAE